MATMNPEQLIEQLQWRYATHKFDSSKKLSPEQWEALAQTLVLTPSSFGLQPWRFVQVQNPEVRQKLSAASWNQPQVKDCSHYVVLCALKSVDDAYVERYLSRISQVRGVPVENLKGFGDSMKKTVVRGPVAQRIQEWAACQVYIALGNLLTAASTIGVDACPMEGLDPVKYDEILELSSSEYRTVVACALGFRSADDPAALKPKVRFPRADLVKIV